MFTFKGLSYPMICRGLIDMNSRIFIGARAGLVLFAMAYHFAPMDILFSRTSLICFAIMLEVTVANYALKQFGARSLARGSARFFRCFFGVHSTAYAAAFGYGCAWVLLIDNGGQYGVSLTATLFCACAVAVSSFAFDLLLLGIFLLVMMTPAIYISFFMLPDAGPLGSTCVMTTVMFFYIAHSIRRGEVAMMQQEQTIKDQAAALAESSAQISRSNNLFQNTLDSIEEVFLTIDRDGACFGHVSRRGEDLLGANPIGRPFTEVLGLTGAEAKAAVRWFSAARASAAMFEKLKTHGPARRTDGADQRVFQVRYSPMLETDGSLGAIIMTMSDVTAQVRAQRAADVAEARAAMILAISEHRVTFKRFVTDLTEFAQALAAGRRPDLARVRQDLHTLKGTARLLELRPVADEINAFELYLRGREALDAGSARHADHLARFVRAWLEVESTLLTKLRIFKTDELTVTSARIALVKRSLPADWGPAFENVVGRFRAISLGDTFEAFRPHVTRVARRLDKCVELTVCDHARDILIQNDRYAKPLKALVHVFNNAIDHGIETPAERVLAGKPAGAVLRVDVETDADRLLIAVTDDGRGIDVAALRRVLDARGTPTEDLTDAAVIERIFDAGVSTKSELDDISGHGIGLNALYDFVRELGGRVDVTTARARGTVVRITIPVAPGELIVAPAAADARAA